MKRLTALKRLTSSSKGFTLIELLVAIAVLGVLAAGVLVALDPVDKINAANDSKVQSDIGSIASAAEAYATSHNAFYAASISELQTSGELRIVPTAPSGYTSYSYVGDPEDCDDDCTSVVVTGQLKSKKYTDTPVQRYESATGKTCQVADADTSCP